MVFRCEEVVELNEVIKCAIENCENLKVEELKSKEEESCLGKGTNLITTLFKERMKSCGG